MRKIVLALFVSLAMSGAAQAQQASGAVLSYHAFFLGMRLSDMVLNTVSQRVPLQPQVNFSYPAVYVCNIGIYPAYIALGSATVTADPLTSFPLGGQKCASFDGSTSQYLAAISQDIGTTIQINLGYGTP